MRFCRMKGLSKVQEQCLLTAICQNTKKVALYLWKKDKGPDPIPVLLNSITLFFAFPETKPEITTLQLA
ncbi:MAG: hypothetical protein H0Z35_05265 [Thermoanaerobacteraceae bacterium]|nr:hypothetical protein [Thermoanaerobacteraceae bacterium]